MAEFTDRRESGDLRTQKLALGELTAIAVLFLAYFTLYFSPATFSQRLLAPGDGIVHYAPALLSKWQLWSHELYAGYPAFADPQSLMLSPLRVFGTHYNAAVVAIYVVAACGCYALARELTGLRGAGVLAALVYASGGAMIAHLGHLSIIYSAAWIPWVMFAIARAREPDAIWAPAIGAAAMGLTALGGHPQLVVYCFGLGVVYATYSVLSLESALRRVCAIRYGVMLLAGVAVAGIQLIPLAEMGAWTMRHHMTFADFTSFAWRPRDLLLFVFPKMYPQHFGPWGLTELACYAGVVTLLLAIAALTARRRSGEALFWASVVLVGGLYALGDATPVARIAYHIPPINKFRAPARAALVISLALAILAAIGYAAIVRGRLNGSARGRRYWIRCAILLLVASGACYATYPDIVNEATARGVHLPTLWLKPAVLGGVGAMALSVVVVFALTRRVPFALVVLLLVLAVDLATFGWYYEWRDGPSNQAVIPNAEWSRFSKQVQQSFGRVLFVDGISPSQGPARPNLNLIYELPSASGYGPLMLKSYQEVFAMHVHGSIESLDGIRRRLQLAGTGWIVGSSDSVRPIQLGGDCTDGPGIGEVSVKFAPSVRATNLEIVSHLGCATTVAQDTPVLSVLTRGPDKVAAEALLLVGRDTAEWAIDRPDVAPVVAHRRPVNSEQFAAGGFNGRWYRSLVPLMTNGVEREVSDVSLNWVLSEPGPGIKIRSLELVNSNTGARRTIAADEFLWGKELELAETQFLPGAAPVKRVTGVGSAAWLVADAVRVQPEEALTSIREGRLPDARPFDPYSTVLLRADQSGSSMNAGTGPVGVARVKTRNAGTIMIDIEAPGDRYLVIAESYYPGWKVTIDGKPAAVLEANYAFQAVAVPAGRHVVSLSFVPITLLLSLVVAACGILVLAAHLSLSKRSQPPAPMQKDRIGVSRSL